MVVSRLIIGAAVVLAAVIARRDAAHRPVAVALGGVLAGDLVRAALELPAQVELGLYLAAPALSAWCALRVLALRDGRRTASDMAVIWAAWCAPAMLWPDMFWTWVPKAAHAQSLVLQGLAALAFWRSPRPRGLPETCAMVLAGGDVLALAGPLALGGPWALVAAQAGVIGAVLVVLQLRTLLTPAGGTPQGGEG
ncbi:hypothetical protein WMF30_40070 [Sorangium sp. So ce134]